MRNEVKRKGMTSMQQSSHFIAKQVLTLLPTSGMIPPLTPLPQCLIIIVLLKMKLYCSTLRSNVLFPRIPLLFKSNYQAFKEHYFKLLTSGSRVVKETVVEWLKQMVIDMLAGAIYREGHRKLWIVKQTSLLMHHDGISIS